MTDNCTKGISVCFSDEIDLELRFFGKFNTRGKKVSDLFFRIIIGFN